MREDGEVHDRAAGGGTTKAGDGKGRAGAAGAETPEKNLVEPPLEYSEIEQEIEETTAAGGKSAIPAISKQVQGVFDLAGLYVGDHWPITKAEADTIAGPACECLDMISPSTKDILGRFSAPIGLVIATGIIVVPRVLITLHERNADAGTTEGTTGREPEPPPWSESAPLDESGVNTGPDAGQDGANTDGGGVAALFGAGPG